MELIEEVEISSMASDLVLSRLAERRSIESLFKGAMSSFLSFIVKYIVMVSDPEP